MAMPVSSSSASDALAPTGSDRETGFGLVAAVVLHGAVVAGLLLQGDDRAVVPSPERMTVNLTGDVGLEAEAPVIVSESQASIAQQLSDDPAPVQDVSPDTADVTQPLTEAQRSPTPPAARPNTRPDRPVNTRPNRRPNRPPPPARDGGGSRVGSDFLAGAGDSTQTTETRVPASQIGASAKASLIQAISRQIKPHWDAPSGLEAEQLVTILAFRLNEDGSLNGRPRIVRQSGVTASNAPQKDLHAERAIRAVQLAAPFDLPDQFYNAWKSINGARFDRNLSR